MRLSYRNSPYFTRAKLASSAVLKVRSKPDSVKKTGKVNNKFSVHQLKIQTANACSVHGTLVVLKKPLLGSWSAYKLHVCGEQLPKECMRKVYL